MTLGGEMTPEGWLAALPSGWTVFNGAVNDERGVPGVTADGTPETTGTARPISAPDLATLEAGWDVVVMMWGTNDVVYPGYTDALSQPSPSWPLQGSATTI